MIVYNLGEVTDWLTAIGTIGAVVVSLYFSFNNMRAKTKIVKYIQHKSIGKVYNYILINKGSIPVKIQARGFVAYKPFWRRKKKKIINYNGDNVRLEQSDSVEIWSNSLSLSEGLIKLNYKPGDKLSLVVIFKDSTEKYHWKKFKFKVVDPDRVKKKLDQMKEENTRTVFISPK